MAKQTDLTDQAHFAIADTDVHQLKRFDVPHKLRLGSKRGLGRNPIEVVRQFTEQSESEIRTLLDGYDMVFLVVGLGGHTGTGSAPVVAHIAKEMGIPCVAVVTTPFVFEGIKRQQIAQDGLITLSKEADCVINIDNNKLREMHNDSSFEELLQHSNDVVCHTVQNIISIFITTNVIGIDFGDVCRALTGSGRIGLGRTNGEGRATKATQIAIGSPLFGDVNLQHTQGLFVNIMATDLTTEELEEVANVIGGITNRENDNIFYGIILDDDLGDDLMVTIVATRPFDDTP
jgi:cell division protein FtsZ